MLVQNCEFGKARFRMELGARANQAGFPANQMVFKNNYFHDNNADSGVAITQGDETTMAFTFDGNTFANSPNNTLFGLFGGVAGPVKFINNTISNVSNWILYFAVTSDSLVNSNGNLLFDNNTIINAAAFANFEYSNIFNVTLSNNRFTGQNTGDDSVVYGNGATLSNIQVNGNTFNTCRGPTDDGSFHWKRAGIQ
jgi:hypothetical protein